MSLKRSIHRPRQRSTPRVLFSMTLAVVALSSKVTSFAAEETFRLGLNLRNVEVRFQRILELILVPSGIWPLVLLGVSCGLDFCSIIFSLASHFSEYGSLSLFLLVSVSTYFLNMKRYKKII